MLTAVKRPAAAPGDEARPKRSRTAGSKATASREEQQTADAEPLDRESDHGAGSDARLADRKWQAWSAHAASSPYPDFGHPTRGECEHAHRVLKKLHSQAVEEEFNDENTPETIPHVLDAVVVAILSQATSWSNAKRAMTSLKATYGSIFAYDEILAGGMEKLQGALRCGGLHVRKSNLIMSILKQVQERQKSWSLDHLFDATDEEAMKELMSYKGVGPKSAFVVMGWCLKRQNFVVDTHVYRIAGLWGWRPKIASREKTQAHLDAVIPNELKFDLHFLMIAHGRVCPACRGGSKGNAKCVAMNKTFPRQTSE